jgi:hypothetical protein
MNDSSFSEPIGGEVVFSKDVKLNSGKLFPCTPTRYLPHRRCSSREFTYVSLTAPSFVVVFPPECFLMFPSVTSLPLSAKAAWKLRGCRLTSLKVASGNFQFTWKTSSFLFWVFGVEDWVWRNEWEWNEMIFTETAGCFVVLFWWPFKHLSLSNVLTILTT